MTDFISKVTEREEARLRNLPKKGSPSPKKTSSSCASLSGERQALGLAPPCKNYKLLITFQLLEAKLEGYHDCQDRAAVAAVANDLKPHKTAIQEVLSLGASVSKELVMATQAAIKRKEQLKAANEAEKTKKKRKKEPTERNVDGEVFNPFESGQVAEGVLNMPVYTIDKFREQDNVDFAAPFVVGMGLENAELMAFKKGGAEEDSRRCLQMFEREWAQHPLRLSVGRAAKDVMSICNKSALESSIRDLLTPFMKPSDVFANSPEASELDDLFAPQMFGYTMNRTQCTPEIGHLATLRITLSGRREVFCMPTQVMYSTLLSQGLKEPLSIRTAANYLKQVPKRSVRRLVFRGAHLPRHYWPA